MKIVLYSGGDNEINEALDLELLRLAGRTDIRMVYVPFTSYEHSCYFQEFKKHYRKYGVTDFLYFAPNRQYSKAYIQKVFNSSVIFLSSGNTFVFSNHIKNNGLSAPFKRFLRRGGILSGMSAGAIVMTPTIKTASVPSLDADPNKVGLTNLKGMNLVPFEFSPHYNWDGSTDHELVEYSKRISRPIIACDDGAGIVIEGQRIRIVGAGAIFKKGKKQIKKTKTPKRPKLTALLS